MDQLKLAQTRSLHRAIDSLDVLLMSDAIAILAAQNRASLELTGHAVVLRCDA